MPLKRVGSLATPVSGIEVGEFCALLVIVTLPVMFPVTVGAKVTFNVALCPGVRTCPAAIPLALKPAPETPTFKMVTLESPEDRSVTGRTLLLPLLTFPKLKLAGLALSNTGPLRSAILRFSGAAGICAKSHDGLTQRAKTTSAV